MVMLLSAKGTQIFRGPGRFNLDSTEPAAAASRRGRFGALRAGGGLVSGSNGTVEAFAANGAGQNAFAGAAINGILGLTAHDSRPDQIRDRQGARVKQASQTRPNPQAVPTGPSPVALPVVRPQPFLAQPAPRAAPPPRFQTCQFGSDDLCRQVRAYLMSRPKASAYIIAPSRVELYNQFVLTVHVDPARKLSEVTLRRSNPGRTVESHSVPWTYTMSAQLEPGASFEATPQFEEAIQTVTEDSPTTWSWRLKAVQAEPYVEPIIVRLKAYVVSPKGARSAPIPVEVLRHEVRIEVPWWEPSVEWAGKLEPVYTLGVALAGALAAAFAWWRSRRQGTQGVTTRTAARRKARRKPPRRIASA